MSAGPIIEVADLRKDFRTRRGPVTAVADGRSRANSVRRALTEKLRNATRR